MNKPHGQYRTTETNWSKLAPYIKYRYSLAENYIQSSSTIYEIGCGIGVTLNQLAQRNKDKIFIGIDNSKSAVEYGKKQFSNTTNLKLLHSHNLEETFSVIPENSFVIALEVIEHMTDDEIELLKNVYINKIREIVFSFPYDQQNIEGTDHLQSFDIYKIFSIFPGFTTLFLRPDSIKFIGYWGKKDRKYLKGNTGLPNEEDTINRINHIHFEP